MTAKHRRLWVIDPSVGQAEDQGVAEVLRDWPGTSRVFRPVLSMGDGPAPGSGYATDGVVLLGSAASVHDDPPWMRALSGWLDPILNGEILLPVLGVCFGHQLIAHVAGGTVGFINDRKTKRLGVEDSIVDGSRLLPGRQTVRAVISHREEVKQPPQNYRVVARRDGIDVDGLEHEVRPVFSFQFHPEAREEFAARAGIDPSRLDGRLREDSRRLLGAFRDRVADTRSST